LRRIITISKLVAEIERSADLMVNICKASRRMYGSELTPQIRGVLSSMSKEANKLLRLSLDAFADENVSLAEALRDIDDTLDQLNRDIVTAIFGAHADESIDLAAAVQLALIARYFERIGDHAVNIGERVTYMVTGWMPEHNGMLRTQNRATASGDDPSPQGDN
jgi:phosphate transport system protein